MANSLSERINLVLQRERSFQNDYKEINRVPNNLDYNRLLDSLEVIISEHSKIQAEKRRGKKKI